MVDYSKWKNIEISDDEDDTHPNIDTPSLFRWRHQARMERMAEMDREKEELKRKQQSCKARLMEVKERLTSKDGDDAELKKKMDDIEKEMRELDCQEAILYKKEKTTPWNVDTISKPGFAKTVINKQPKCINKEEALTDEQREEQMKQFIEKNEKLIKQYAMLRKYNDSKKFLLDHPVLVDEHTANFLVIWAINLEMEEKHELMNHVAHQCVCMQYILELAKQLTVDPRACVGSFFTKIQNCVPEYREQFESEIAGFKDRIQKRAKQKIQEAIAEEEEEERKARLGPGGLDPQEVYETLPEVLQKCFESRDIDMLKEAIKTLSPDDAKYHMKRCVDSGLWVPNAEDDSKEDEEDDGDGDDDNQDAAAAAENAV